MPVEMRMWRIDGEEPRPLSNAQLPSEKDLEDFLEKDPTLLGTRLLVIGRQVHTPYGKFIDLLAMDADGNLHVLELKRDKTPREVVAQVLDYGEWVADLTRDEIIGIANDHLDEPVEAAFEGVFGDSLPDEINGELQLTVVASSLDSSSERIVTYLRTFGVPINAVFFSYLEDDDRSYLARSWLVSADEPTRSSTLPGRKSKKAEWNGRDWYVGFGGSLDRRWTDARKYGFVSAGGGAWYSRSLRGLPMGARIWVNLPGEGYVGVGETLGEAVRFADAQVEIDGAWVPLMGQALDGTYDHGDDDDTCEWVVPVRWTDTRPGDQPFWEKGMFANQNTACKIRQEFTVERLYEHFNVEDD